MSIGMLPITAALVALGPGNERANVGMAWASLDPARRAPGRSSMCC